VRTRRENTPHVGHRPCDNGELLDIEGTKETGEAFLGRAARAGKCLCAFGGDLDGQAAPVTGRLHTLDHPPIRKAVDQLADGRGGQAEVGGDSVERCTRRPLNENEGPELGNAEIEGPMTPHLRADESHDGRHNIEHLARTGIGLSGQLIHLSNN
jgi:hypothetical protein